jgi:hypothetical protein
MRAQQQASPALGTQHGTQFAPGDFKLRGGARMPELIQARKLQQNIQAAYEGARGGRFCVGRHLWLAMQTKTYPVQLNYPQSPQGAIAMATRCRLFTNRGAFCGR